MNQQTDQPAPDAVDAAIERLMRLADGNHGTYRVPYMDREMFAWGQLYEDIKVVIAAVRAGQEARRQKDEAWENFEALGRAFQRYRVETHSRITCLEAAASRVLESSVHHWPYATSFDRACKDLAALLAKTDSTEVDDGG